VNSKVTVLLAGNTAGTNAIVAQNFVLVGGNNVTLSGDPRGSVVMVAGSFNTAMGSGAFAPIVHTHSQYLTTAANSTHSHGGLSLSNLTGTSASNGLTLHAANPGGGAVISVGSFSRSTGTVEFGSTAGNVSFGMDSAGYITANGPGGAAPAGLGLNTAVTGSIGMTGNTSGLSISIPNFITTYASQTVQPAVGLNTALTANGVSWTVDSSGISMNVPAFITTYASQTVQPAVGLNSALTGNGVSATINSSGISLNVPAFITTYASQTVQPAVGLNSALTANGVSATINSSGLSLNFPAFLTTYASQTVQPALGLNSALTANGVSATMNSSGVSLNFPAFLTTARGSTDAIGLATALTNLTGTINSNGISLSAAAAGAAAAVPVYWCCPPWAVVDNALITNMSNVNNVPFFMPFYCDGALTGDEFHWVMSRATNGSNSFTVDIGFYSIVNSSSISLASSVRAQYVGTNTASMSGIRIFEAPLGAAMSTLKQGAWVLGLCFSATATVRGNYSIMGNASLSGPNSNVIQTGTESYAGATAHQMLPFFGRYTVTTAALPNNVRHVAGTSEIIGGFSGASMPIAMNWTICNHYI
jgi:hypothetical protein